MFKHFFEKLFCSHNYIFQGSIPCTYRKGHDSEPIDCPIDFYTCEKCGKRLVLKSFDNYKYTDTMLQTVELWEKGQLDINFNAIRDKNEN